MRDLKTARTIINRICDLVHMSETFRQRKEQNALRNVFQRIYELANLLKDLYEIDIWQLIPSEL